jgi:hypothetical protein
MLEDFVVYRLLNILRGKCYIGITHTFRRRKRSHLRELLLGKHHSVKLQRAYNIDGLEAFEWSILEENLTEREAFVSEVFWIRFYNAHRGGYNMNAGGERPPAYDGRFDKPCVWNGVEYPSMTEAGRQLGMSRSGMQQRISMGLTCDADVQPSKRPCTWNGIEYASVTEAADALGIPFKAMESRIRTGKTKDEDVTPAKISVTWNGVTYPSISDAAKAVGVAPNTLYYRIKQGYVSDDDMAKQRDERTTRCTWNGVEYSSYSKAAEALGMSKEGVISRILRGYTCDDDLRKNRK